MLANDEGEKLSDVSGFKCQISVRIHRGSTEAHSLIKKSTFIFNSKSRRQSKIDSLTPYYLHLQNPDQPSNARGLPEPHYYFFFLVVVGSAAEKGRLK